MLSPTSGKKVSTRQVMNIYTLIGRFVAFLLFILIPVQNLTQLIITTSYNNVNFKNLEENPYHCRINKRDE
ncbi:MAG: hypothetical protein DHS20C13_05500 [Thermodesulfobacteriota bacterium]|nr:MAG: hypothetical protein DHS20C13_05500 [Thermodesulfobacteriota bacterium]